MKTKIAILLNLFFIVNIHAAQVSPKQNIKERFKNVKLSYDQAVYLINELELTELRELLKDAEHLAQATSHLSDAEIAQLKHLLAQKGLIVLVGIVFNQNQ